MIQNSAGEGTITARYGGEEFAVVLNETGIDDARNVAEKIRGTIEVNSIEYEEGGKKKRANVTVSSGISELTGNESRVEFIERADKQMYRAKQAGKNKVCPQE